MLALPAIIALSAAGLAYPAPRRPVGSSPVAGPSPAVAGWIVLNGLGRSYDHVCFHLVYGRGCGDHGHGLIKHSERVLGLPNP